MSKVSIIIKITIPNKESFPEMPIGAFGAGIYSLYSRTCCWRLHVAKKEVNRGPGFSQQTDGLILLLVLVPFDGLSKRVKYNDDI